ncbi:MAG: asparagine synthase (glutamine-hydrolyzing) [bacterium]
MCGICGVYNYGVRGRITASIIERMRDTMVHRGPDGAGWMLYDAGQNKAVTHRSAAAEAEKVDATIGFGHRRLSIIDLSEAGAQPMSNEDGTVWITYNGEIYNHPELCDELKAAGHVYHSRSDTETIIHAYEEWGDECVHHLEGMFGFGLYDVQRRRLLLVRDRIGIKPLYYSFLPGRVLFASEIKAILEFPDVTRDIDQAALYHYLTFITTPAPLTLFKGIFKLPPGHLMTVENSGAVRVKQWWDLAKVIARREPVREEGYYIENIRHLLSESIRTHMMSDVPFGVFLSGGIDSSMNVALMSRHTPTVRTFSIAFKDQPKFDEFQFARQIAKEFATDHHEVVIDEKDLIDFIPQMVFHQDEPIADWVCVPLYYVSKLARDNNTIVVQVGEGSDEQFSGYDNYINMLHNYRDYWAPYMRLPRAARWLLLQAATALSPHSFRVRRRLGYLRKAVQNQFPFWGGAIAFLDEDKKPLLKTADNEIRYPLPVPDEAELDAALGYDVVQDSKKMSSYDFIAAFLRRLELAGEKNDPLKKIIYIEFKQRLCELLLMRVDKITMATSVESRVPFLDHKLVEFAMSIPSEVKVKGLTPKYILKKACEGIIPDNIIYRKKVGFGAPVQEWFSGRLGDEIEQGIMNSRLRTRGLLNYDYIQQLVDKHRSGAGNYTWQLWILFNLSRWYDLWIEKERI